MTQEFFMNVLNDNGIKAELTEVVKNGVAFQGIMLGTGAVRPTIYSDFYEDANENEIEMLLERVKSILEHTPQFDMDKFQDWDWAKTRLQLCIQQKTNEEICKRDFLDMEQYVRVIVNNSGSFKVKPNMLEDYGITEDVLFQTAMECTKANIVIEDVASMMAEMFGVDINELEGIGMQSMGPSMIVVTTESKSNGASVICFPEILKKIADNHKSNLVILPSSIHECILYPNENIEDIDNFNTMVREVNETQLLPEEILSGHAYIYDRTANKIFVDFEEYAAYLEQDEKEME